MKGMKKLLLCLLLSGCTLEPFVPDTARLAPGQLGTGFDPDVTAMNLAQYSFADASRLYGRPVDAARAAASMDYVAGEFYTSPRWANISALTKEQLLQGRAELRAALGIAPAVPSQAVVDHLTAAAAALAANDVPAATAQLGAPVFSPPPAEILARLNNLPYLRMANVSTMNAANEMFRPDDNIWR